MFISIFTFLYELLLSCIIWLINVTLATLTPYTTYTAICWSNLVNLFQTWRLGNTIRVAMMGSWCLTVIIVLCGHICPVLGLLSTCSVRCGRNDPGTNLDISNTFATDLGSNLSTGRSQNPLNQSDMLFHFGFRAKCHLWHFILLVDIPSKHYRENKCVGKYDHLQSKCDPEVSTYSKITHKYIQTSMLITHKTNWLTLEACQKHKYIIMFMFNADSVWHIPLLCTSDLANVG